MKPAPATQTPATQTPASQLQRKRSPRRWLQIKSLSILMEQNNRHKESEENMFVVLDLRE
jgi:hypothetical protein